MTLYWYLKEHGFASVDEFVKKSGITRRTLNNWFNNNNNMESLEFYIEKVKAYDAKQKKSTVS